MATPDIEGLEILDLIGKGACGEVFLARYSGTDPEVTQTPSGKLVAVRTFSPASVNIPLIEGMLGRVKTGNQPDGMVPTLWRKNTQGELCLEMPLLADPTPQGSWIPRTLEQHIKQQGTQSTKGAWLLVEQIGRAIASMHQHRIPHGNLKPGNIFFTESNTILLTDVAMGHMPRVHKQPMSDALLYTAPEQLEDPAGYLSGKAYGWDCYSFGTIAFQLLTGKLPLCESSHHKVTPPPHQRALSPAQEDVIQLSRDVEKLSLADWINECSDPGELERRKIIQRCLALDPEERFPNLVELLHAWRGIDNQPEASETTSGQQRKQSKHTHKSRSSKWVVGGSLTLAAAGLVGCLILNQMRNGEINLRENAAVEHTKEIKKLEQQITNQTNQAQQAAMDSQASEAKTIAALASAESKEKKHREQLVSLGVANDHLIAWMMRNHSKELPELQKSGSARDTILKELEQFLKLTEGNDHFQPVRARIMMQLAELKIHNQLPEQADQLLDAATTAWKSAGIEEPGHSYRIARARLACLMQALDQKKAELARQLLPKARAAAQPTQTADMAADSVENKRLQAVMHIIDGRMLQDTDPEKALTHFQQAIQDMQGIRRTLTENIIVRSDLARYALEAANLATSLNKIDDAEKLRSEAATSLERLLEKNPNVQIPKIQLAEIYILAATSQIREGNDQAGSKKLSQAEKLLAELPLDDLSPNGVAMQVAAAKGLRAVLLGDSGSHTEAKTKLNEAIQLTEKIVAAQGEQPNGNNEPLYRLAVLHWQLAGLIGDSGSRSAELQQGKKAAGLMEELLGKGAGKHDLAIRRALGYLYGDLGHTAFVSGSKKDAITYYQNAAKTWQSLITRHGNQEEYQDGLKWSQSRAKEMGSE